MIQSSMLKKNKGMEIDMARRCDIILLFTI